MRTRQAAAAASELWVGVLRASLGGRIERSTLYAEASFSIRPQTFECVLSSARRVWPIAKPEEVETWPRTLLAPASLLGSLRAVGAGQGASELRARGRAPCPRSTWYSNSSSLDGSICEARTVATRVCIIPLTKTLGSSARDAIDTRGSCTPPCYLLKPRGGDANST